VSDAKRGMTILLKKPQRAVPCIQISHIASHIPLKSAL
jgi:hypothetical protein